MTPSTHETPASAYPTPLACKCKLGVGIFIPQTQPHPPRSQAQAEGGFSITQHQPPRPTKAHSSQRRSTAANVGLQQPAQVHSSQHRPTKAHSTVHRLMKTNTGLQQQMTPSPQPHIPTIQPYFNPSPYAFLATRSSHTLAHLTPLFSFLSFFLLDTIKGSRCGWSSDFIVFYFPKLIANIKNK